MVRVRRAGAEGLPLREGVEALGRERFDRLIRYLQEAVAFAKHVGAKVREIEPERAVLYTDVEEVHLDGNHTLHGGVHSTLIDSAMSLSLIALTDLRIATAQMNVHFLGPVKEGCITCQS